MDNIPTTHQNVSKFWPIQGLPEDYASLQMDNRKTLPVDSCRWAWRQWSLQIFLEGTTCLRNILRYNCYNSSIRFGKEKYGFERWNRE